MNLTGQLSTVRHSPGRTVLKATLPSARQLARTPGHADLSRLSLAGHRGNSNCLVH
jgi:hypothetical protein